MFPVAVLLVTALALPAILFLLFRPRTRLSRIAAILVAVAAGWAFNVACVVAIGAMSPGAFGGEGNDLAVVTSFGWFCPLLTVLATWLVWTLIAKRRN